MEPSNRSGMTRAIIIPPSRPMLPNLTRPPEAIRLGVVEKTVNDLDTDRQPGIVRPIGAVAAGRTLRVAGPAQ
jgi:hypothetical protein